MATSESSRLLGHDGELSGAHAHSKGATSLPTLQEELHTICVRLAIPNIIILLASSLPAMLTTAKVGRDFTVLDLSGLTLANLVGNLCSLSLINGLLSASDTLSPQAYGSGNAAEVGFLAVRGLLVSTFIIAPTIGILVPSMEMLLIICGQDSVAAARAATWYGSAVWSLPFYAVYEVTVRFLSAQNILYPVVLTTLLSCGLVLPWSLFVWAKEVYQTAVAVVLYNAVQAMGLLLYLWVFRPHDENTWVIRGLWKHALKWEPLYEYLVRRVHEYAQFVGVSDFMTFIFIGLSWILGVKNLGLGGILASSEWIYWELLSLIAGTLGVLPLSVHAIPTQIITVLFMIPLGLSMAVSIRIGANIAESPQRARYIALYGTFGGCCFSGLLILLLYYQRWALFGLFSTHIDVLAGCEEIWWDVCFFFFHLTIFAFATGVCTGLGLQWALGTSTVIAMFGLGLPLTFYCVVVRKGGLVALWRTTWPPYLLLNIFLFCVISRVDWDDLSLHVRQREQKKIDSLHGSPLDEKDQNSHQTT